MVLRVETLEGAVRVVGPERRVICGGGRPESVAPIGGGPYLTPSSTGPFPPFCRRPRTGEWDKGLVVEGGPSGTQGAGPTGVPDG